MDIKFLEIVAAGIYNSDNYVKGRYESKNRRIKLFELEIPLEKGGVSYINDESHIITPETVICAKPEQLRHTRLPHKCFYIHFIVYDRILFNLLTEMPSFTDIENTEEIYNIFREIIAYSESASAIDGIMLQSRVLELVYTLSKAAKIHGVGANRNSGKIIDRIIEYINEHITEDLSLKTLARQACISPIHFHNCFRTSTGRTVHEYVEDQRIKKAKTLLLTSDMTLADIAYKTGFSSQSYFSYAFKRKTGMTPREYVKTELKRYER